MGETMLSELELELKDSLKPEGLTIKPSAISKITSNKMKRKVAVREASRMKLVHDHPLFKQNPLTAIRLHLEQMTRKKEENASIQ